MKKLEQVVLAPPPEELGHSRFAYSVSAFDKVVHTDILHAVINAKYSPRSQSSDSGKK